MQTPVETLQRWVAGHTLSSWQRTVSRILHWPSAMSQYWFWPHSASSMQGFLAEPTHFLLMQI